MLKFQADEKSHFKSENWKVEFMIPTKIVSYKKSEKEL